MEKLSLDDILAIGSQDELRKHLDDIASKVILYIGSKSRRSELPDSVKQFIKTIRDELGLSFAGIYIDGDQDINYEIKADEPVFGRTMDLDPMWQRIEKAHLDTRRQPNRLITPLRFRDTECYGVAVAEKHDFSERDVQILRYCGFDFASHINNIGDKSSLRVQAITDELTSLYNRRRLNQVYKEYMNEWLNHKREFGVIFIDLDYFKQINTRYGHPYADYVLMTAAHIMKDCLRDVDVLARYGGEEFVALMPGASAQQTELIARRISDSIRAYRFKDLDDKKAQEITISVGCVSSSEENLESNDLMGIADKRMLAAKGFGRDFVVSNVPIDVQTGLANMPSFLPYVENKLRICNRPVFEQPPNLALVIFDIVGFSDVIQQYGNKVAWDVFKDVAWWFFGERQHFDYIARAYSRDQMVVALSREPPTDGFLENVEKVAHDYRNKARSISLYARDRKIRLDFGVGGIVYDPKLAMGNLISNPEQLFTLAENITEKACNSKDRVVVEYYKP